ncbi:MAG: hypothetical protein ABII02_04525 [Candidatus Magasanikbacteria bacterium]
MKYKRMYLGAWALGSTIHLKELYQAMAFQKSPYFKSREIRAWQKGITPKSIDYIPEAINSVAGQLQNEIAFDVLEDGVILLSKEVEDTQKDFEHLEQFMNTKMRPFWRNLSSKDVAIPSILLEKEPDNPIVIHLEKAKQADMEEVFSQFGAIVYKRIKLSKGHVWIGERLVVINDINIGDKDLREAVHYLMFARLYELQLKKLLDIQRTLWNQIEGIRNRKYFKSEELPTVRDRALSIQSQGNFFRSRSRQMNQFLVWREEFIDTYLTDHVLGKIFKEFFVSLKSTQQYIHELWTMTHTYADSTVESISLMYSDMQQRELRTLQKIFLVSAIVSVLSLGTLAGSQMLTSDTVGNIISQATIRSWEFSSFIYYGSIVLIVTSIFYILFYLVFSKLKGSSHIS